MNRSPRPTLCDQLDDQYMPITFHQAIPTVIQITVLIVVIMKPLRHHSPFVKKRQIYRTPFDIYSL